jgi:hypothetical protein
MFSDYNMQMVRCINLSKIYVRKYSDINKLFILPQLRVIWRLHILYEMIH